MQRELQQKPTLGWKEWTFLAAAVMVITAVTVIISPAVRRFLACDVTAAWASAIATTGAVIVALYTAGAESRRRRAQAKDRAALHATYIVTKLERYVDRLRGAATGVFFADLINNTPAFARFRKELGAAVSDFGIDQIVHLVPLEERAAHRLARGIALVEALRADVEAAATREIWQPNDPVTDAETFAFGGRLQGAVDMLTMACRECSAVADSYATRPTGDELYGPPF